MDVVAELVTDGADAPSPSDLEGAVLFLETGETMPLADEVAQFVTVLGNHGLLLAAGALVIGRPKAWDRARPLPIGERDRYAAEQKAAVRAVVRQYNRELSLVFNVDIGHTDPQFIVPYGGYMRVDAVARRIAVLY
jgi:muramoyltetrapeptide carboxypeptidase LdcA involved in peptidoglycan recycling